MTQLFKQSSAKENRIKRFEEFIKAISEKDRIGLLFHSDADGFASGLIAFKAIQKTAKPKSIEILFQRPSEIMLTEKTVSTSIQKFSKMIIMDLCFDQFPENYYKMENKLSAILVLDHHKIYNDLESKKTIFLKSQFFSSIPPSSYPVSKLSYDLFSRIVDLEEFDWIACLGLFGDMAFNKKEWKKYCEQVLKKHSIKEEEFKQIVSMINAVQSICPENFSTLFEEFLQANNPKELLKSNYANYLEEFEKEAQKWMKEFEKKATELKKQELMVFEIKPKFPVKAEIINRISQKFPHKTIVIIQDKGKNTLGISARRQDSKVAVNRLLEESVNGLENCTAGGHIPAAGGTIQKKYKELFIERLIENSKKN